MKGAKCPHCGGLTFHDNGSLSECSVCKAVGWSWRKEVTGVGKGKGNKCPNCGNQTLHQAGSLSTGKVKINIRRCATCDYSLVEPPGKI